MLIVLTAMLSIQSGAALAKGLFASLGPEGTTVLRIGFAALLLLAVWRPSLPTKRAALDVLGYGVSLGLMNLTFYCALARIPLGAAVALEFSGPLVVALWDSRRPLDVLWVVLAGLGIALLSPVGPTALDGLGVAFALGAGVAWGLYIVFGQRAGRTLAAGQVTSLGMAVAALTVAPVALVARGPELARVELWPMAFLVAMLSSAIPYSLEMMALRRLPARRFSLLMSLEPVVASLSGFLLLGERLIMAHLLAIALIAGAVVGSTLTARAGR